MSTAIAPLPSRRRRALIAIAGVGVLVYLAAAVFTDTERLRAAPSHS